MMLSQFALEDVEALCLEPSFLMADPTGPLLDKDEEALSPSSSLEEKVPASLPLPFSSVTSPLSPYHSLLPSPLSTSPPSSPPHTHPSSFLETKAGADSLSFAWLGANNLLEDHVRADDDKDDAFAGMDWMSEKIDLSDFDLESLIGSCSSDESPSSPEDLLASLDSHMDLDLDSWDAALPARLPVELPPAGLSEVKTEVLPDGDVVMKTEPCTPAPPPSPAYTLELESEVVHVSDKEKPVVALTAAILPGPSGSPFVLSLPNTVMLLTNKDEPSLVSVKSRPLSSDCESDSGIESVGGSPSHHPSSPATPSSIAGSSRTKPYSKPEPASASSPAAKVKQVSGAPKVVEKKQKKMEQNKTAATRYRQKKRVEQELLNIECEELEKRNNELSEKAESISREIQYLKDLMEEVRKHHRGKTSAVA